ncbi:hypothetical protein M9Y10_033783 [Tritrichomonas musculus]|uniref:Uncharacterized protein n=1 Tax=Tritrichomonas musculus TaxID=1915356 RepID=A0ABR2KG99_9EUKA
MDSWFNDPFFQNSGDPSRDIRDHFAQVEQQMNNMMNSMFRGFDDFGNMGNMRLGFDNNFPSNPSLDDQSNFRNSRSRNRFDDTNDIPEAQEASPSSAARHHSRRTPIVEEPDDDDIPSSNYQSHSRNSRDNFSSGGGPQTYFYSSSTTSYYGPDGIQHSKRKTYDSSTGKTEMAEMRKLGNQAVAKKKEIDRDGHVTEMMDTKNLNDDEVDDFQRRFKSTYQNPSLGFNYGGGDDYNQGSRHHHHHHRALK